MLSRLHWVEPRTLVSCGGLYLENTFLVEDSGFVFSTGDGRRAHGIGTVVANKGALEIPQGGDTRWHVRCHATVVLRDT